MSPLRLTVCALSLAGSLAWSDDTAIRSLVERVQAHRDGGVPCSVNFAKLGGDRAALPIGVFDSGIGGLTVMDAILQLDDFHNDTLQPGADGRPDFAGERFIYFGDQANMPYGNYPSQGREDFLRELIVKDAVFLLGDRWRERAVAASLENGYKTSRSPGKFDSEDTVAIPLTADTLPESSAPLVRSLSAVWQQMQAARATTGQR